MASSSGVGASAPRHRRFGTKHTLARNCPLTMEPGGTSGSSRKSPLGWRNGLRRAAEQG
jgi:hypothetical protein